MESIDLFLTSTIWKNVSEWLLGQGILIVAVILLVVMANHFIGMLIDQIVRHTVRNTRFSHVEITQGDLTKRQDTLIGLFIAIAHTTIWAIGILIIVKALIPNLDFTPLFASAGIIGVALGFGAQSVIKDFLTGIFIISENQYRVGDIIDIDTGTGASGTVEKVSVRSTVVRDVDGNVHYVPNGTITHVINKTMGFSKVNFTITVIPDTNIDKLAKIIDETGLKMSESDAWKDRILEAPHFINIGTFTDAALEVLIAGKTQPSQQWSVTGELRRRLLVAFQRNNIHLAHTPLATFAAPIPKKRR